MNAQTQREEDIFDHARKITDPAARAAYLDRACAGEVDLRVRLEGLLSVEPDAEEFFAETFSALKLPDKLPFGALASLENKEPEIAIAGEEPLGSRIGRYKLIQKIGEGGCGIVYNAEQEEPVRRGVALKIIKLGMETKSVIERFEAERQALAMMDHPNIAHVFDAGATDRGRPYFVMELVRGIRITEYCDQNHLDIRARLELFIKVCHAIQHAHQKGIIHGDIKPSNIMVTLHDGRPVPKVIDFGISKATEARLTDKSLFTCYAQLIGTPAYMSPEQTEMGGLDIDTRSDIYSLGVVLYELLTGRTPFDSKALIAAGLEEMRKTLREKEPPRPSLRLYALPPEELAKTAIARGENAVALMTSLRDDLDWVAMKALGKDRARRYETANGLAMDVQRYLDNEPVVARPPSRRYRLRKLIRRNRGVFIAMGAVGATLVAGMGTSTWLFLREREARQRAVAAEQQQGKLRHDAELRAKTTQAALFVSQERFDDAEKLLGEIPFKDPTVEGAAVLRMVGEWHAFQGRWREAADRLTLLTQINQLDGWDNASLDCLRCGPALLEAGDIKAYERFRREAIARFGGTACPFADRIVKVSLLTPATKEMIASLQPLVEANGKSLHLADAAGDDFQAAWRTVSLALLEYRSENYSQAIQWCERCLAYPEYNASRTATARIILAMAYQRLGRGGESRTELQGAREILETKLRGPLDRGTPVQGFWFDWIFASILAKEASILNRK